MKTIKWLFRIIKSNFKKYSKIVFPTINDTKNIITFNIRRDSPNDGENNWEYRKDAIVNMILDKKPSIICMQECMPHMWKYLYNTLKLYYGEYSVDAFNKKSLLDSKLFISEGIGILFDINKYRVFDQGYIKLHKGFGFDTKYWRVCQYIGLYDLYTNEKFYVFNTHFEHKTRDARHHACELIDNKIQEICKDYPVYICGDFNAEPNWTNNLEPLVYNYKCSLDKCINKGMGTVCGFGKPTRINLDLCFYKNTEIDSSHIITDSYNNKYLSDHYPVIINI